MTSMRLTGFGLGILLLMGCGTAPLPTTNLSDGVAAQNASLSKSDSVSGLQSADVAETKKNEDHLEIEDLVKQNLADLRRCYEHALDDSPGLEGVMTVNFEIDKGGNVLNERTSGIDNEPLETCVLGKFSSMEFPKKLAVNERLAISYPLVFNR